MTNGVHSSLIPRFATSFKKTLFFPLHSLSSPRKNCMTSKLFTELGLSSEILKAIDKLGFEQASPIHAESIPPLMQGSDVVGQSQPGSGNTAAFAIPAIENTDTPQRIEQVHI